MILISLTVLGQRFIFGEVLKVVCGMCFIACTSFVLFVSLSLSAIFSKGIIDQFAIIYLKLLIML